MKSVLKTNGKALVPKKFPTDASWEEVIITGLKISGYPEELSESSAK